MSCVNCHMSHITCQMSHVACPLSPVTCHLSLTATATDLTIPLLTPPLCTVGWLAKTQNTNNNNKKKKPLKRRKEASRGMPILAIRSWTRSLQSTRKLGLCDGTHTQTDTQTNTHTNDKHCDLETE